MDKKIAEDLRSVFDKAHSAYNNLVTDARALSKQAESRSTEFPSEIIDELFEALWTIDSGFEHAAELFEELDQNKDGSLDRPARLR